MTMTVVQLDRYRRQDASALPSFEGEQVEELRAKLTSSANLEVSETHHRLEETARLLVTGRVTRIDHVVDQRTGRLIRVETFRIVDAVEVEEDVVEQLTNQDD